ncbi:MAG TPA: exo-alpha-sialidase [Candidatus Competibacteraceae bacterium]|nr:exo-alpha-sialidase [Candidatus Competibacteraceae bacterium]
MTRRHSSARALCVALLLGLSTLTGPALAETTTLAQLRQGTHIHGIAVDAKDPSRLYLATHHGFFLVSADGQASRLSEDRNDYMGFTPHPTDSTVLYASGHPAHGGNMGFLTSTDGGKTWQQLSKGIHGPVDFHQMDVSAADPKTVYGAYGGNLQVSKDGGRSWTLAGPAPEGLIDLAASPKEAERLYAATKAGLLVSQNGGKEWSPATIFRGPASLVQATPAGDVYAFIVGVGLLRKTEPNANWSRLGNGFGEDYLLHLAVDPTNPQNLYAVTQKSAILVSRDGGGTWAEFGAR